MAQRPQPSLRLADGGSFITRWAQSVMRPNATTNRLREVDAPPPPPAAPVRAPAPPPPNPNATPDNPAGIRFQDGGHVPGTGRGDKIPAKYEPGEFVVSNDMIDDNPGLREQLSGLRANTLAARGKTVEEADAKALNGARPSLRAAEGFPGIDVDERPWRGSADSRLFARDPGPGNPNVGRTPPAMPAAPAAAPPAANVPAAPVAAPAKASTLRNAASAVGDGILYGGAALGGAAVARGMSGVGAGGPSVAVPGERQSGDSTNSTQIPVGGDAPAPNARPYNFWTDSEVGRNVGNMASAVAPLGGVAMASRVPGAASKAFGVADAALGGLSAGIHNERTSANTATSAATTLRIRPEDTFAGPPESARSPVGDKVVFGSDANPGNVTRNGNSYEGTDVRGNITINGFAPGAGLNLGSGPNAQNMAAANNLAATDSLRSQGAALGGQPAGGSGMPAMPQTQHSGNSWEARNNLRNLAVSASSITNRPGWSGGGRGYVPPDVAAYQNAQAMDVAKQAGADPGSVSRNSAQASMFGSKTAADASRYGSDNSLRSQMYTADAQLGGKQLEMQQRLRQQQAIGGAFRDNKGDPAATARALAGAGLTDAAKSFQDMAGADQARTQGNVKDARSTFENMFTRDGKNGPERDENAEALAHSLTSQIVPGWENMSAEQRAANRTKVVDATKVVQGMNRERNASLGQWLGVSKPTPAYSQLPDLNGAQVGEVGFLDGLTPWGPAHGATKVTLRNGQERYIPKGELSESQQRLLENNGARPEK